MTVIRNSRTATAKAAHAAGPSPANGVALPYWQLNMPPHLRPAECPEYLRNLSDADRRTLETPQADVRLLGWRAVCRRIVARDYPNLVRTPLQLRAYLASKWKLKEDLKKQQRKEQQKEQHEQHSKGPENKTAATTTTTTTTATTRTKTGDYDGATRRLLREVLGWEAPIVASGAAPFARDDDLRVVYNEWPLAVDPAISHLVCWLKFRFDSAAPWEDPAVAAQIQAWIDKTILPGVRGDGTRCVWWLNPPRYKSVIQIEHFHMLLYKADPAFLRRITKGHVPNCRMEWYEGPLEFDDPIPIQASE